MICIDVHLFLPIFPSIFHTFPRRLPAPPVPGPGGLPLRRTGTGAGSAGAGAVAEDLGTHGATAGVLFWLEMFIGLTTKGKS